VSTRLGVPVHDLPARPTALSEPFWAACTRGELTFQRCGDCSAIAFPPAQTCRRCLSPALTWQRSSGLGRLYSWTVVWRPVTPAFTAPYAPAIVDVAEGYQILTNVINAVAEDLTAGLPLAVTFRRAGALCLPYFQPV
jgi:uncharacterized OB-fold protein